jgi:hypothetical protein
LIAVPRRGEGGRGKETGEEELERCHLDFQKRVNSWRSLF